MAPPDPPIDVLREVDRAVSSATAIIDARIDGIEKGIEVFRADLTRVPTSVDRQILSLRELADSKLEHLAAVTSERFLGVAAQFSERDTRTDQRAGDTKLAVDAAFAAAKEATAKIEAGFTKQIDAMISIIDTKSPHPLSTTTEAAH